MIRLICLQNDPLGEGILVDDTRHLVSQVIVPNQFDFSDITTIDYVDLPTNIYTAQMQLLSGEKYWLWPITDSKLKFPESAASHTV